MPDKDVEQLNEQQVRDALDKRGSVNGAAEELGVSRQAVYWHMGKNDIPNPYTGRIPTMGQNKEGSDD